MSPIIRKAQPQDVPALTHLLRSFGWFRHLASEPVEDSQRRIAHHLELCHADDSHSVYVAEENGEVLGYAAVHWLPYLFLPAPEGFVSELFVSEAARGGGLGTRLLAAIKTEAQARGCSRLLLLNSRDRDSYQRKFYEKRGWQEREDMANFALRLEPGREAIPPTADP